MELLQVFDENRNMLNESVERDKKKELPFGKYFMIILLFIQNDEGKFLIQKAAPEKDGMYSTTGGHVTYKDNSITTVIKEANEELGINLTEDELLLVNTDTKNCCHIDTYYCQKNLNLEDLKLQEEEVESVYWLSKEEIEEKIDNGTFRKGHAFAYREVLNYKKKVK